MCTTTSTSLHSLEALLCQKKMKQGLLWRGPCQRTFSLPPVPFSNSATKRPLLLVFANAQQELTARERRRLRNERRESKSGTNWREEVEERLIKKPKKRYTSWTEELNLDYLAKPGPQWWAVRVTRIRPQETAELLARSLAKNFPDIDFKVYAPAIHVKKKLKNGSSSVIPKPLFPGCVFLRCVLNKEIHDFVQECEGVGGFVGSKVGNMKRQINKPRAISVGDMEAIFRQAKEEQEKSDRAFEEESLNSEMLTVDSHIDLNDETKSSMDSKPKRRSGKASNPLTNSSIPKNSKLLAPGSTIRVASGAFAEFEGNLKKVNRKTGKVTVGFMLFGKESLVDLDVNDIIVDTN